MEFLKQQDFLRIQHIQTFATIGWEVHSPFSAFSFCSPPFLLNHFRCDVCVELVMLFESGGAAVTHVTCNHCQNQVIA